LHSVCAWREELWSFAYGENCGGFKYIIPQIVLLLHNVRAATKKKKKKKEETLMMHWSMRRRRRRRSHSLLGLQGRNLML
jgi:hypothetical protein